MLPENGIASRDIDQRRQIKTIALLLKEHKAQSVRPESPAELPHLPPMLHGGPEKRPRRAGARLFPEGLRQERGRVPGADREAEEERDAGAHPVRDPGVLRPAGPRPHLRGQARPARVQVPRGGARPLHIGRGLILTVHASGILGLILFIIPTALLLLIYLGCALAAAAETWMGNLRIFGLRP